MVRINNLGAYIDAAQANNTEDECCIALQEEINSQIEEKDYSLGEIVAIFDGEDCEVIVLIYIYIYELTSFF